MASNVLRLEAMWRHQSQCCESVSRDVVWASNVLRLEATWRHQSQYCERVSRDAVRSQTSSKRNSLNQKNRLFVHQGSFRSSSFHLCVVCSSLEPQPRRKSKTFKPSRPSKSDADLQRELRVFISSAGLPPDQVPSTKELASRGREDLANIVRRRGYKAVARLLTKPDVGTSVKGIDGKDKSMSGVISNVEDGVVKKRSNVALPSAPYSIKLEPFLNGSARSDSCGSSDVSVQDMELRSHALFIERPGNHGVQFTQDGVDIETPAAEKDASNVSALDGFDLKANTLTEESTAQQLLHKRAAEFVRTGKLDLVQNSGEMQEEEEEEDDDDDDEEDDDDDEDDERDGYYEDSSDEGENEGLLGIQRPDSVNAEAIAVEKAAKLRAQLLPFIKDSARGEYGQIQSDDLLFGIMAKQQEIEKMFQRDLGMQSAFGAETQRELDHIKSALRTRELELVEMSRELEEAKAQLALVQAKATVELAQAKQIALEKDIRLKSADQVLANLKQVQIEYWGEGGRVQLAGSFNGWQHHISLEPDATSEIPKSDGSRGPMMWATELWLYPGIYEIKFIVDGNWKIDQRREVVTGTAHHNNILRVEL